MGGIEKPETTRVNHLWSFWLVPTSFSTSGGAQGQELIKKQMYTPKAVRAPGHIVRSEVHFSSSPSVAQHSCSTQALRPSQSGEDEMQGRKGCCFPSREWAGKVTQWKIISSPRPRDKAHPKGEGSCGLLQPGSLGT